MPAGRADLMPAPPPTPPARPMPAAAAPARGVRGRPGWLVWLHWAAAAAAVYAILLAAHWPLLHLPYYWDEAGYFVPAALDLFRHGWWIPRTTLANGHPPLLMAVLALAWHILGVSIATTRATMLVFGAALVLGTAHLVRRFSPRRAAWIAALWLALAPLVFAQSTLAQLDLPAAALAIWALAAWVRGRRWWYAGLAAAACLTKETAILVPLVLGLWAVAGWLRRSGHSAGKTMPWWPTLGPHLIPAIPLAAWFAYYHAATGFWMGNAGFLAYNLQTAASLPRIGMALALRAWQVAGYDGMAAITIAALWAWWRGPKGRRGKPIPAPAVGGGGAAEGRLRAELWSIIAAYVLFHSLIGGAVLARYLLPAIALYIALLAPGVAAIVRPWPRRLVIGAVAAFLLAGWFWNPPYPFPYEDNLAYAQFVRLQQRAAAALAARHPARPVLTAWPATNELTNPDLGYVTHPLPVVPVENFSAAGVRGRHLGPGQFALLYSRVYQPAHLRPWPFWLRWKRRFFHYRPPLPAPALLRRLGAERVWGAADRGQWVMLARGKAPPAAGRERPAAPAPWEPEPHGGRSRQLGDARAGVRCRPSRPSMRCCMLGTPAKPGRSGLGVPSARTGVPNAQQRALGRERCALGWGQGERPE